MNTRNAEQEFTGDNISPWTALEVHFGVFIQFKCRVTAWKRPGPAPVLANLPVSVQEKPVWRRLDPQSANREIGVQFLQPAMLRN